MKCYFACGTKKGISYCQGPSCRRAEQFHLSTKLDRWVTSTTFEWLASHPERLRRLSLCAINLSGHSLTDEDFLAFIKEQFRTWRHPRGANLL